MVNDHKCNHCMKIFSRSDSLKRHLNGMCKVMKKTEQEKEKIYQELMRQMNEQNKKIEKLENQNKDLMQKLSGNSNLNNCYNTTNTTNNTNTNTNSNNINSNNTVNIIAFGSEDLYTIFEDKACKKFLHKGYQCVPSMIEDTHFDINKPELHNVYIPNMKDLYAMIYDGKRWGLKEMGEVIDQLFDDKQCFLIDKFNDLKDDLNPIALKKFNRFINHSDDDIYKNLKKDIKLLLYNKRDIPLKTRRGHEHKTLKMDDYT
jgi:chorismate mutase